MKKIMILAIAISVTQCTFAQVSDTTTKVVPPVTITGSVI